MNCEIEIGTPLLKDQRMNNQVSVDREQFERDGYTIVADILTEEEMAAARPLFDELLPPDVQPPICTGDEPSLNGRKQLVAFCGPRMASFATHRRMVAAAEALLGPLFLLNGSPIPAVTYKSPPGQEHFELGYHVDWPHNPPEPTDERGMNGCLHFHTMEPGGVAR